MFSLLIYTIWLNKIKQASGPWSSCRCKSNFHSGIKWLFIIIRRLKCEIDKFISIHLWKHLHFLNIFNQDILRPYTIFHLIPRLLQNPDARSWFLLYIFFVLFLCEKGAQSEYAVHTCRHMAVSPEAFKFALSNQWVNRGNGFTMFNFFSSYIISEILCYL